MTAIGESFQKVKDFVAKYWFIISSLALAVLYFLYNRQGKKLASLYEEAQLNKTMKKIDNLVTNAKQSEEKRKQSFNDYLALKRRHPDVLSKLGLIPPERKE